MFIFSINYLNLLWINKYSLYKKVECPRLRFTSVRYWNYYLNGTGTFHLQSRVDHGFLTNVYLCIPYIVYYLVFVLVIFFLRIPSYIFLNNLPFTTTIRRKLLVNSNATLYFIFLHTFLWKVFVFFFSLQSFSTHFVFLLTSCYY